jgi:primosomal protein N' (replication factor Y)
MLPPGLLERVVLVVRAIDGGWIGDGGPSPDPGGGRSPHGRERRSHETAELLAVVRAAGPGGIPVEELPRDQSRATRLRRLRELEAAGTVTLEWHVREAVVRPRQERHAALTEAGRSAAADLAAGARPPGTPLGARQVALLTELAAPDAPPDVATARLAERHGSSAVASLVRRGLLDLHTVDVERRPLAGRAEPSRGALPAGADLSAEQRAIVERITAAMERREGAGFLLEGPTASGKTAVYAAAIGAALAAGRGALVLVPEIALAVPIVDRLRHDLGVEPVLLHSALGEGERADEWRRVHQEASPVVVGTRIAVMAPIADPGVIVVDEEHDAAYKSDRTPRIQARDVALELGRLAGAPVILASATPDIVSVGRARAGALSHVRLTERAAGRGAHVEVVDLRAELAAGNRGLLSEPLVDALRAMDREAGDRAILVINRRGSASVVLCRDCGHVQACPDCQRPLVFHASVMALRCHHCGATAAVARRCPACGSARIRYLGGGTERVEREVRLRLPELRVGRLDRDVVERRGEAARIVDDYTEGRLDVLVGTSLVTKGLDVPETTLVGVVSADIALSLPDERAAERTWQLLAQAVGRAGRGDRPGRAFIQTYLPDHPAIVAVSEGDAGPFVEAELERRRRFGSPPFGRLVKLTAALEDREAAEAAARALADTLRERSVVERRRVSVLGPVPAYVARRGGRWRFHVVLRGDDPLALLGGDPGPPWSVDVDPESLL